MEIREYKPAHRKAEKSNQFEDLLYTRQWLGCVVCTGEYKSIEMLSQQSACHAKTFKT